jgi:glycosyltransferase involved in cell wall biosynthesis
MTPRIPRVTFVIDDLAHGGAQRQLWLGVAALAGRVEIDVVALSAAVDPYARRLEESGARVIVIPRRSGLEPGRARELVRRLRASRADVVHAMLDGSNAYAFVAARRLRIPVVLSLRSDRVHVQGARGRVLHWMLRHADAVTVNSAAGFEYLSSRAAVPAGRLLLVPNIVAAAPPVPRPVVFGPHAVGCVGRLAEVKRFDAVIAAMPLVRRRVADARLVVVGDGPCRESLQAAARESGAEVDFTGAVEDASPLIAGFACLAVASEYEGIPNAALEALSLGVPVATVPAGDLPVVVADGVTGAIARDGSPEALAEAVVRALTDVRLRESARRAGPRVIRERFAPEKARDALLGLYVRLATKTGAAIPG